MFCHELRPEIDVCPCGIRIPGRTEPLRRGVMGRRFHIDLPLAAGMPGLLPGSITGNLTHMKAFRTGELRLMQTAMAQVAANLQIGVGGGGGCIDPVTAASACGDPGQRGSETGVGSMSSQSPSCSLPGHYFKTMGRMHIPQLVTSQIPRPAMCRSLAGRI